MIRNYVTMPMIRNYVTIAATSLQLLPERFFMDKYLQTALRRNSDIMERMKRWDV